MFGKKNKKNKYEEEFDIVMPLTDKDDEEELIAVITAAVAMILEKPASGFRVVSFKPRPVWKWI